MLIAAGVFLTFRIPEMIEANRQRNLLMETPQMRALQARIRQDINNRDVTVLSDADMNLFLEYSRLSIRRNSQIVGRVPVLVEYVLAAFADNHLLFSTYDNHRFSYQGITSSTFDVNYIHVGMAMAANYFDPCEAGWLTRDWNRGEAFIAETLGNHAEARRQRLQIEAGMRFMRIGYNYWHDWHDSH